MNVAPCRTYHAVTTSTSRATMADGRSVYKIYFVSIIGRERPELYEWERSACTRDAFEQTLRERGLEGIGFAIAFPHVTKVFRFGPGMETVLDISEYDTPGLQPKDCDRGDGFHEFACYAEAVIAAEEYHAWARAASVEEYLEFCCNAADFPVASNDKLGRYWSS